MTPLPENLRRALLPHDQAAAAAINRSLLFDKTPDPEKKEWKQEFFSTFAHEFTRHDGEYDAFIARRSEALSRFGAHSADVTTTTRLIVGHGLPHTTQIGFLFDRLRGVPYLPGSTVKGLLRETARLIAKGELASDPAIEELSKKPDAIFGTQSWRGALDCEDAYAVTWPMLEVDVMTPHHSQYYESGSAPGDWESPVPVCFLTIAPQQRFRFWFVGEAGRVNPAAIEKLLTLGLEWLGVGGKKSSGYGRFFQPGGAFDVQVHAGVDVPHPRLPEQWPQAQLTFTPNDGFVTATWQGKSARAKMPSLPDWFKKKKLAEASVMVEGFTIVSIDWPQKA